MDSFLNWLNDIGGPVSGILVLMALVAASMICFKLLQFWYLRPAANAKPQELVRLFADDKPSQLRLLAKGQRNSHVRLIEQTQELLEQGALTGDVLKAELFRRARLAIAPLETHLRPLEVIAVIAPLLGLFGTVLGMIDAFRAMEAAGSQVNPSVLSGGIWEALLTTAIGLAVAIPVTMIHSALERKVDVTAANIQNDIEQMLAIQVQKKHLNTKSANIRSVS